MKRGEGWVQPLVIDPTAGQPTLIGRWRRIEPVGDEFDEVVTVGAFDLGADWGGLEIVFTPALEFGPTVTASPESFSEAYTRAPSDPSVALDERLAKLADAEAER